MDLGMGTLNVGFSAASNSQNVGSTTPLKRKLDDIGWEYGELVTENNSDKVKCKLCDEVVSGGIYLLKQHVAHIKGNVASCAKSTLIDQAKCKETLQDGKKKKDRKDKLQELQDNVIITERSMDDVEIDGSSKVAHTLGSMVLSGFSEASERMVVDEDLFRTCVKNYDEKIAEGVVTRDGQPKVLKAMTMMSKPLVETDEKDDQPVNMRMVRASAATKPVDSGATSSAAGTAASEAEVTGLVSSGQHELVVRGPEVEYKINMKTEETVADQTQRKMREFFLTVTELGTGFATSEKKNEELTRQVTDLGRQIREWKDQKANWDEKKKVLERDCDEAWEEAGRAIFEKRDLKEKLEKAAKEAQDARASAKQFASTITDLCTGFATSKKENEELRKQVTDLESQIRELKDQKASWDEKKKVLERYRDEAREEAYRATFEKRDLEKKLEKAIKEAEDAKASAKKARSEASKQAEDAKKAVISTRKCHKIGLGNFVAYLASGEGRSVGDYVSELVAEMPRDDRALADGAVDVAGHEGDGAIKDEAP